MEFTSPNKFNQDTNSHFFNEVKLTNLNKYGRDQAIDYSSGGENNFLSI